MRPFTIPCEAVHDFPRSRSGHTTTWTGLPPVSARVAPALLQLNLRSGPKLNQTFDGYRGSKRIMCLPRLSQLSFFKSFRTPRIRLMRFLVTSIFLYTCESWTLTAELQRRIKAMEKDITHLIQRSCYQRGSPC